MTTDKHELNPPYNVFDPGKPGGDHTVEITYEQHKQGNHILGLNVVGQKIDPLASEIEAYPAYWRKLPEHWIALDYYRVRELFPLPPEFQSARLDHSLKKLLVPGIRTGGKSFYKDVKEAHATLGQWLKDNQES